MLRETLVGLKIYPRLGVRYPRSGGLYPRSGGVYPRSEALYPRYDRFLLISIKIRLKITRYINTKISNPGKLPELLISTLRTVFFYI